jgi:UDP-N-acetylmuramate-alanine ligase
MSQAYAIEQKILKEANKWKEKPCSSHYHVLLQDVQQQEIIKVVQHTHNVMNYTQAIMIATYSHVL